ncbi:MAG: DUF4870 domain-containing protein [Myxococcota bacterium]
MTPPVQAPQQNGMPPTNMGGADAAQEAETRQWAMILHLSLLGGLVVPLFGLVAPILIWQLKKDEMPGLDAHGKMVANWVISAFIYAVVGAVLSLVLIGILLLMALGVVSIVFPIIGGIKAKDGELWKYPLTIQFLK